MWEPISPAPLMASQISRGEKLYCVSYTPFRGGQTPLDPATMIPAIEKNIPVLILNSRRPEVC